MNNEASPDDGRAGRSVVRLPAEVEDSFDVYINGVPQTLDVDYLIEGPTLVFARPLHKDRISGWRWLLGAWGVGTYRPDDTVDIRYELGGQARVAHALPIEETRGVVASD